jgi:hypothetical protein
MQCSKELWFPDGDLVVQVEKISFRIYAKGLAESSTVFAAMLALPQPVEGDTVDGLPVVRLFDTDADAALLLKALFDKTCAIICVIPAQNITAASALDSSNHHQPGQGSSLFSTSCA